MLGSVGVIAGSLIIMVTDWLWIDPIIAIGIGLWVLPRTWILLSETVNILLEGVPKGMDLTKISERILQVDGVGNMHDLHIWALSSDAPSLSAHVVIKDDFSPDAVRKAVELLLQESFDITHVTLQTEAHDCREDRMEHSFH